MWPDRVSNSGPPTYKSDALPIALRGPAICGVMSLSCPLLILTVIQLVNNWNKVLEILYMTIYRECVLIYCC